MRTSFFSSQEIYAESYEAVTYWVSHVLQAASCIVTNTRKEYVFSSHMHTGPIRMAKVNG